MKNNNNPIMEGFKKVAETGGTYVVATFFNPETKETLTKCVRDYDNSDGSRDDDELYSMPIDEQTRRAYLHHLGNILVGDKVRVIKGRKLKLGTVAHVRECKQVKDRYGRWVADYVVLDTGESTNAENCEVIEYA